MKRVRLISLTLAAIMSLCALASCGGSDDAPGKVTDAAPGTAAGTVADNNGGDPDETEPEVTTDAGDGAIDPEIHIPEFNTDNSDISVGLTAEKIVSVPADYVYDADGGLYYQGENGKYGIMSYDGKTDTGAIYDFCTPRDVYFAVTTTSPTETGNVDALNCVGVVDANGKVLVPEEYASLKVLNDRYIQAYKVTEKVESEDEALVYFSDEIFSIFPDDDDLFFKGVWYVYDVTTGKTVDGVTGTNKYYVTASGDYIEFTTDDGEEKTVNGEGKALPEGAKLLDDGSYLLNNGFYSTKDELLFTYDPKGIEPISASEDSDYIVALDRSSDSSKYMLLDFTGKVVSASFNSNIYVYGSLLGVDNDTTDSDYNEKLYDFAGNVVFDEPTSSVYYDELTGDVWMIKGADDKYTMITADGAVLYQSTDTEDDDISISASSFSIEKENGDDELVYCLKDKDFTVNGSSAYTPWLAKADASDYKYDIVDTISGKTLISGYKYYDCYKNYGGDEPVIYVHAKNYDGVTDIYAVK